MPATVLAQPDVRDLFARQPGITRLGARMIGSVFDAAAIDTRHTVLAELAEDGSSGAGFLDPAHGVGREVGEAALHHSPTGAGSHSPRSPDLEAALGDGHEKSSRAEHGVVEPGLQRSRRR